MEKNYYQVSEDITQFFEKVWGTFYMPIEIKYVLIGNTKLKSAVKVTRLNDLSKHLLDKEIVIEVNEDYMDKIDDLAKEILISQELAKVAIDTEKDRINLIPPDLVTFASVVKKYTPEKVLQANQLIKLMIQQEEDAKREAKAAKKQKRKSNGKFKAQPSDGFFD